MTTPVRGPAARPAPQSRETPRVSAVSARWIAALLIALTASGCSAASDAERQLTLDATTTSVRPVRTASFEQVDDTVLMMAIDVVMLGDFLYLSDGLADRVVRFDTLLRSAGFIGTHGSGPGEMKDPWTMAVDGDRLAVADIGNQRVSFFGRDGDHQRTVRLPIYGRRIAMKDGELLLVAGTTEHDLIAIDSLGNPRDFGRRPVDEELEAAPRLQERILDNPVAVAGDDTWIFDIGTGELRKFDSEGRLSDTLLLPDAVMGMLAPGRDAFNEGMRRRGVRMSSLPLAKDLAANDSGELVLIFTLPNSFGLLIDPRARSASLLTYPSDSLAALTLRQASAIAFRGNRLIAAGNAQIAIVELERVP